MYRYKIIKNTNGIKITLLDLVNNDAFYHKVTKIFDALDKNITSVVKIEIFVSIYVHTFNTRQEFEYYRSFFDKISKKYKDIIEITTHYNDVIDFTFINISFNNEDDLLWFILLL